MLLDIEAHMFFQLISWTVINLKSQNPLWALSNEDSSLALSYDRVKAMIWIFMPLQTKVQFFYKIDSVSQIVSSESSFLWPIWKTVQIHKRTNIFTQNGSESNMFFILSETYCHFRKTLSLAKGHTAVIIVQGWLGGLTIWESESVFF